MTATATTIHAILAVLNEREAARNAPTENPLASQDLASLGHGMRKGADNFPAVNMAAKAPGSDVAHRLEESRFTVAEEGKADKSRKRMAVARSRAQRKVEFDKIAASKKVPSKAKMAEAWVIVVHLVTIIDNLTKSKQRWASRYLGSNADDIPSMAREQIALVLAKQTKWEMSVLTEAAAQLGKIESGLPGAQVWEDDDPAHIKQVKKARKWLMGMVYNRIMGALVDSYTMTVGWESLDLITTVMASIGGVGDDPLSAHFKAGRAPMFMGTRFQRPGGINPDLLATAIMAAISEKGLDQLTEFILDDANRQTNGAMMWTRHAEAIFKLTPGGYGDWMWDQVIAATRHLARADNFRGEAAMNHVRNLFEWLPSVIVAIVESFDPHAIGFSPEARRVILASDFELFYLPEQGERLPLQPALRFPTIEEAAVVLANAMSGEDHA